MRSTTDLIKELQEIGSTGKWRYVALAVGFEKSTEFISSLDGDGKTQLEKLNSAIHAGGEPVGYVGMTKSNTALNGKSEVVGWLLKEYEADQQMKEYISALSMSLVSALAAKGIAIPTEAQN